MSRAARFGLARFFSGGGQPSFGRFLVSAFPTAASQSPSIFTLSAYGRVFVSSRSYEWHLVSRDFCAFSSINHLSDPWRSVDSPKYDVWVLHWENSKYLVCEGLPNAVDAFEVQQYFLKSSYSRQHSLSCRARYKLIIVIGA